MALEESVANRTKGMSADEVLVRLKDRLAFHKTEFRNAFNQFDYKRKGKITRKDFKIVRKIFSTYITCFLLWSI